jgi:hypothetical protein
MTSTSTSQVNAPLLAVPGSHCEGLVKLVYRDKVDIIRYTAGRAAILLPL